MGSITKREGVALLVILAMAIWTTFQTSRPEKLAASAIAEMPSMEPAEAPEPPSLRIEPSAPAPQGILLGRGVSAEYRIPNPALPEMVKNVRVDSTRRVRWDESDEVEKVDGRPLAGGGYIRIRIHDIPRGDTAVTIRWSRAGEEFSEVLRFLVK